MDIKNFIDVDSAKERFMSNETLYKRFLFELPDRTLYQNLKGFLAEKKVEEAFEAAHRMKGVIDNLSLNLLGMKTREMVEILRVGELPDSRLEKELEEAYTQSIRKILYIKENNIQIF